MISSSSVMPKTRTIPSLDGMRAVSIVLVLLGHLYGTAHYPRNAFTHYIGHFAHLGVQIFFVISGFLITTLLLKEKTQTGSIDLVQFFFRRSFRIFPAAFFYVTVVAVIARPGYLAYAYTYTMCYASQARPWLLGHLWSLSVEEQFYLLWPAALVFAFRWRRSVAYIVLLFAPLVRFGCWELGRRNIDEYFPAVADNLMMGCLLAFYLDRMRQRAMWLRHPAVFAALGLLIVFSGNILSRVRLQIFLGGLVPLAIALFLFAAMERQDWLLNHPVTRAVGVLSSSIYLWQHPLLNRTSHQWWAEFPLNVVLAVVAGAISYWIVERPFLRLFHSWKRPKAQESIVAAS